VDADFEYYISRAEIAYKRGQIKQAIRHARRAGSLCPASGPKYHAVEIFIARAYSRLGQFEQSNRIYRGLVDDKIYLPPVIMGLLYNNLKNPNKSKRNIALFKVFTR